MQSTDWFKVKVIYLKNKVDLQNYWYENQITKQRWKLKDELQIYVKDQLRKRIKFPKKSYQAQIIDQKVRLSGVSGLFQFDPFLFIVDFRLQNLDSQFDEYQLDQNKNIKFCYQGFDGNYLPSQKQEQISDNTQISLIIRRIGLNLGICQDFLNKYQKRFQFQHLKRVSDLKAFTEQQLNLIFPDIPRKIIKEIYLQASKIDYYREGSVQSKKLKELKDQNGKKQCIKISNGHKLLRYFLYKKNNQEIKNVPYLNWLAIKKARQIIQKIISLNKQTWAAVDEFLIQFGLSHKSNYEYSRGAIFNGPPGTGKTVLTELLITLCGFFQISKGITASDFMKSLVGEAGRFIQNLFSRAEICPWLATFISIDQIEAAFPKRSNKQSENKGDIISKFLSMIEGNKNVPNLFILSATNHIDKIDEAILRRLGDRNDLARLNNDQRIEIFRNHFSSQLKIYEHYMQKILKNTMNFTGAAMVKLLSQLQNKRLAKRYFSKAPKQNLSDQQIMNLIEKIAKQYKVFFGSRTFPALAEQNMKLKRYLNKNFLKKMTCSLMFIGLDWSNTCNTNLFYFNKIITKDNRPIKELEKISFNTFEEPPNLNKENLMIFFQKQFQMCFQKKNEVIICKNIRDANQKYQGARNSNNQPIILLIKDQVPKLVGQGPKQIISSLDCYNYDKDNVYLFYICQFADVSAYVGHQQYYKRYSGRVMVEVNESPQIVYETEILFPQQQPFYIHHYLPAATKPVSTDLNDIIIDFFNKRKLSNIFMIDNSFLESKGAFTNEKECQTIKGVIEQAKELASVAIVIDFDSLLMSNKTKSLNKDEEQQFDVDNKNLYKTLINRCKDFPYITEDIQRWVVIIALDNKMIKKIRKDIAWPQMPEEARERLQYQKQNLKRTCFRCGQQYTQKQNQEQKRCAQHPGEIINTSSRQLSDLTVEQAIIQNQRQEFKQQNQDKTGGNKMPLYIYSCCFANVKEIDNFCAKMNLFRHVEYKNYGGEKEDLAHYRNINIKKWQKNLRSIY